MALDFPSSPANNQTFTDSNTGTVYTFNGVYNVWNSQYTLSIGTANNANYLGGLYYSGYVNTTSLASYGYINSTSLSSNLSGYQTTAGLSSNVATLTANNTSFVGTISAANVVSNAQLSGNLANYVTATNLTNNLANYQTTAGLSSNVAGLTANNSNNFNGQSYATVTGYITGNAATAYSNAVSYVGSQSFVNSAQLSSNLTNYVNTSAAYTFTNVHTYSANIVINNNKDLNFQSVNTSAYTSFIQQNDDNFVMYSTNTVGGQRAIWAVYGNSVTSNFNSVIPFQLSSTLVAGGSNGSAGQVLTSNGNSPPYWSTVTGGSGSVNVAAQYTWTNTQTFSANVSFTGNNISLVSNTGSILFAGSGDNNWKIGRNTGATTKLYYTNNSLDIIAANTNLEGIVFGWTGNSYLEIGYAGTFTRNPIYVGNSVTNVSINSTSFSGTANNALYLNGNSATDLRTYSSDLAANAYSNAVSYAASNNYVNSTFAQNTAIYSYAASNTYVNSTFATNTYVNSTFQTMSGLASNVATLTSNNTSFVGTISAANVVSNAQLSANLANYVTSTNLTNNLANYQTTAGLSSNVAGLTANNSNNFNGQSYSTVTGFITANAATAYSNAIAYAASNSYVNTTFAPKASPTFTGVLNANDVVISGNLTVTGTTVTVNAATLDVKDLNITVAKGSTAAASDGAGITVDGSNAQLYYNYAANSWFANRSFVPDADVTYDLGSDTKRWRSLYISGSTIVLGSANISATGSSVALPSGSTVNGINLESFAVNTYVNSTFAQNTAIYSYAASNTYVNSTFATNTYVNSTFQTTAGLSSNVATLTSNNTSFVGSVSAANVVSNSQLSSNLSNYQTTAGMSSYQTTAGLSSNVATLTSNNTSFVGTVSAANVVSNAQLSANLSNYQTTAGLSSNVATLTSNNTSFVGSVSATDVVSNAQLSGNLTNYQTTAGMSSYQTTAGLSSNVATLTSNNTSFVGSVSAANVVSNAQLSANLANYVNTSGAYTFTGIHTHTANVSVNGAIIANGGVGTSGQFLTSSAGGNVYWSTVTSGGGSSVTVSDTAPSSPSSGNLWYYTGTGELLVYYNDGTSSQWVTASATYVPTTFSTLSVTGPTILSGNVTISNTVTANASTGTAGQVLTSSGAGANVYWSTPSSGVTTGKAIAMAIVFGG